MVISEERTQPDPTAWWAAGDFPVRDGCVVTPLIDGRAAMLAMCQTFLSARQYILLAGWDINAELPMVRGNDVDMGSSAGADHDEVAAILREHGLDDEAIAFWNAGRLRVVDVLGFAVRRGVRVGVLLWDAYHLGSHMTNDPTHEKAALESVGVDCLLDDSSRHVTHLTQSLHQKCAVVDGSTAFVGGIDLTVQDSGDYDRWDTHHHPCTSPVRTYRRAPAAHPWHDVHAQVRGPVVTDLLRNLTQRWKDVAQRHNGPDWPAHLSLDQAPHIHGGAPAQIIRTIPPRTYTFAPKGITTIKDAYLHALKQARQFVYIENQYLWPDIFLGLDSLRWSERSPDAMEVLEALAEALGRGVQVAITLPDHPNCGRRITDGGIDWIRHHIAATPAAERFHAYTLGSSEPDHNAPGHVLYRPVYTHAKVAIVDDLWWTVGSANLNSRGLRSDAEINVAVLDAPGAQSTRLALWAEHLHRGPAQRADLMSSLAGMAALQAQAQANRDRVRRREPLVGHLLSYLTFEDGRRDGVPVHHEHGWLDNHEGGVGALAPEHAGRYL